MICKLPRVRAVRRIRLCSADDPHQLVNRVDLLRWLALLRAVSPRPLKSASIAMRVAVSSLPRLPGTLPSIAFVIARSVDSILALIALSPYCCVVDAHVQPLQGHQGPISHP
jgi:hypothetical protein